MNKKFCFSIVSLMFSVMAFAQKPVVAMDGYTKADNVSGSYAELVNQAVISGINNTNRFELIAGGQGIDLSKAQYLFSTYISQCEAVSSSTEGGFAYNGEIRYKVTVVQAADRKVVATKDFNLTGLLSVGGDTQDEAVAKTMVHIDNDMKNFVDEYFKLQAIIAPEGFTCGKKGMEACYITIGRASGINKGQKLDAFCLKEIMGNISEEHIGSLTVTEVVADNLSKCKVTKGGEEINKVMQEYLKNKNENPSAAREIIVRTKKQGTIGDLKNKGAALFGF